MQKICHKCTCLEHTHGVKILVFALLNASVLELFQFQFHQANDTLLGNLCESKVVVKCEHVNTYCNCSLIYFCFLFVLLRESVVYC